MSHEAFEIAVEQRVRGALDPTHRAALDEHLASCDACREYESRAYADDKGLKNMFAQETLGTNWSMVEEHVQRSLRTARRMRILWPVGAAAFVALLAVGKQLDHPHRAVWFLFMFALGFAYALIAWRLAIGRSRAVEAQLAKTGGLEFARTVLDQKLTLARQQTWGGPVLLTAAIIGLIALWGDREVMLGLGACVLISAIMSVRSRWILLPRLLRERAALE